MMTVNEISKLTGVSIRTLQYYDNIGLLKPSGRTDAGYRLYDDESLKTLQQILLYRELEFPLKEIKDIITAPGFDKDKALKQQIEILTMKRDHFTDLIGFAKAMKTKGVSKMDFEVFDTKKIDEYSKKAKAQWGGTSAYKEFEEKNKGRSIDDELSLAKDLMQIFAEFGEIKDLDPSGEKAQSKVKDLQNFISKNYYNCTNQILLGLGQMYAAGGEMTDNIDASGGKGCAAFVAEAIKVFVK